MTNETYFILENDWVGYLDDGQKYFSYVDAINALHEKLEDINYNWLNKEHPKSKWNVEMVNGEKRTIVYKISATKAKKLIKTKNYNLY
tara:strand:- start:952 stop:1215 length:264 start_codon:yes stop_codon:yes gene_type:complete